MPIPQSQTILKSYFETGDKPTQAQFAELIDTMFYLFQNAQTTSNSAVTLANLALAAALGKAMVRGSTSPPFTRSLEVNIASVTQTASFAGGAFYGVRVTFTNAFANANYFVVYSTGIQTVTAKNAAYIDLTLAPVSGTGAIPNFELALFGQ